MLVLTYIGTAEMPLRHRVFQPGETVTFDMDDQRDALLYEKCRALPLFVEGEAPKPVRGSRRAKNQA